MCDRTVGVVTEFFENCFGYCLALVATVTVRAACNAVFGAGCINVCDRTVGVVTEFFKNCFGLCLAFVATVAVRAACNAVFGAGCINMGDKAGCVVTERIDYAILCGGKKSTFCIGVDLVADRTGVVFSVTRSCAGCGNRFCFCKIVSTSQLIYGSVFIASYVANRTFLVLDAFTVKGRLHVNYPDVIMTESGGYLLCYGYIVASGAMRALRKTACGTGSGNGFVDNDVVTKSIDDLLCYGYIIARGAMRAFGKACCGTGSGNGFIDDDIMTESIDGLLCYGCIVAFGTMKALRETACGTGSGNGFVDNDIVTESADYLLCYDYLVAFGAMRAFGKTVCGTGSGDGFIDDDVVAERGLEYMAASGTGLSGGAGCCRTRQVTESLGHLLCYGYVIASGAMITLGKTRCSAGSGNCFIGNDAVTESRLEYVVASDTGLSAGAGRTCACLVTESLDDLLLYGFGITSGAMLTLGKAGGFAGGRNCFFNDDVVTARCSEHCITYSTDLSGGTGCSGHVCRVSKSRNIASRYGRFNRTLCIGVNLFADRTSVVFFAARSRAGCVDCFCFCELVAIVTLCANQRKSNLDRDCIVGNIVTFNRIFHVVRNKNVIFHGTATGGVFNLICIEKFVGFVDSCQSFGHIGVRGAIGRCLVKVAG